MPFTIEDLRNKYKVMTHTWLLPPVRQPGRPLYEDLTESTCNRSLHELLSAKNFLLDSEVAGEMPRIPKWEHDVEYEFQIPNEALKLVHLEGCPIQKAIGTIYRDQAHRMEHWVTLLTIFPTRLLAPVPPIQQTSRKILRKSKKKSVYTCSLGKGHL